MVLILMSERKGEKWGNLQSRKTRHSSYTMPERGHGSGQLFLLWRETGKDACMRESISHGGTYPHYSVEVH